MVVSVTADEATTKRYSESVSVVNYLGSNVSMARGPQAFVVECAPAYVITPHFHPIDQFQVFFRGSATIGKHALEPVTVHYTDGFTPYGPITGGSDGFAFFNFRARADVGALKMPESKDELARRAGRALTARCRLRLDAEVASTRLETLVDPYPDGLAVLELVAAADAVLPDEIARGSGRYQFVLAGELVLDGRVLPPDACAFAAAGDVLTGRRAGPSGLHLLEVQLPSNA
jgi:hypothetical protein